MDEKLTLTHEEAATRDEGRMLGEQLGRLVARLAAADGMDGVLVVLALAGAQAGFSATAGNLSRR